ncbi:MAG TPA: efflux RND transporter periplasmic adaptor subunit [Thermoanaerobaculia bacterium]|nr:efflux RND transporter periplasmic adaptor subunit [Thermoanaerobaculia bacterium]
MRAFLACALLALTACSPAAEIPEDPPPLPVKIEKAARAPFRPTLVLLGVVRPAKEADVMLPSSGRLRYPERFRDGLSSGVQVRAGEVLARLVNGDTESAVAEAKLRLAAATSDLARFQKAFDLGVVPAVQLATYKAAADLATQQWEAARTRQGTLELRSPVTGWLVVERQLPPEGEVQPGTLLARVAAGGPPRVEARAAAGDRGQLHTGLDVRFVLPGTTGAAGRGVIREISPLLEAGGTAPVVAEVTSGAGLPAPGEGVEVDVELDPRPDALTVPEEALVISEGAALFVVEEGLARRRTVTTGGRGDGRIEVISGLAAGDKVVVNGAALLSDGSRVEAVQESAAKVPAKERKP